MKIRTNQSPPALPGFRRTRRGGGGSVSGGTTLCYRKQVGVVNHRLGKEAGNDPEVTPK